ncbi:hypothetical protein BAUCODRAFT_423296 [Baudoinia panamericana UAMH 10762]|uniref:SIN1-domain-containing protein n=1 Tax=Baudoinia panamericana (strain UAMH 10762) TaxID=717646 RepID=M2MNX9_BAUPA|nr:uncharacterized protein BAUCODRAFT_423296 [Baudoinia panamericana UAMH 10762]EMC98401.1 hypothetical protein BAUCODRAFT_423296 [Baudoinia panamericana UAMH 10762]
MNIDVSVPLTLCTTSTRPCKLRYSQQAWLRFPHNKMSLLLNEDFTLYRLRLGYLTNAPDGIGERLISLNTAVLNEPAFRAAGWLPDTAAIKRCYSPPIPTTGAADYFNRPSRSRHELVESPEETQNGLISGHRGSEDTLGPSALTEKERRRRKKVQGQNLEEDDSSDLSDDSDEDDVTGVASVTFAKMPMRRRREGPSPIRESTVTLRPGDVEAEAEVETDSEGGPEVKVISPSYGPRTSSLAASEALNVVTGKTGTRPRRDTTTSSEMSSENEALGTAATTRLGKKLSNRPQQGALLSEKIAEEGPDESEQDDQGVAEAEEDEEDVEVAEASDLSDEFEGDDIAAPSPVLPIDEALQASAELSKAQIEVPPAITPTHQPSPRKSRDSLPKLPRLPSGKPMPSVPLSSLLSMAFKQQDGTNTAEKPYQKYAGLSGKGEAQPLWIKIYAPWSKQEDEALEVPLRRVKDAEGGAPTVNELIGLALWRYDEEGYEPPLKGKDSKVENWELRMVEDGEVDMDFPALSRARAVTDFTSNNNRPPQRRMRDKPWDEFGLVRAESADEAESDGDVMPAPTKQADVPTPPAPTRQASEMSIQPQVAPTPIPSRNPITGPSFTLNAASRKDSTGPQQLLDLPAAPTATSTPRMGPVKTVSVHFTDPQSFQTTLLPLSTTADTYIAELFDLACARLRLDKALYVFKVRGTQTVAPSDRTVEALGSNLHLDLVRRRFGAVGDFGLGLSGSPGSSSPNAPLELVPNTPPTAKEVGKGLYRRKGFNMTMHNPLTTTVSNTITTTTLQNSTLDLAAPTDVGRRYVVQRKLPLSFSGSHPRTLVITPEYMQILPAPLPGSEEGAVGQGGKVTNVPMTSIVGVKVSRKHPKMIRVLVYREKETKRYDFECGSHEEAERIVADIRVGLGSSGGFDGGGDDGG